MVEEIRRFLDRVGALHIDGAVDLGRAQHLVDAQRELAQIVVRGLLIGICLVDIDPRDLRDLRQLLEHLLAGHAQVAAFAVLHQIHPVLADARQRAGPDEQVDPRQPARGLGGRRRTRLQLPLRQTARSIRLPVRMCAGGQGRGHAARCAKRGHVFQKTAATFRSGHHDLLPGTLMCRSAEHARSGHRCQAARPCEAHRPDHDTQYFLRP